MRIPIEVSDDQIRVLARICERKQVSRTALIRRAIAELIASEASLPTDDAFGAWREGEDGLDYQCRHRAEW